MGNVNNGVLLIYIYNKNSFQDNSKHDFYFSNVKTTPNISESSKIHPMKTNTNPFAG